MSIRQYNGLPEAPRLRPTRILCVHEHSGGEWKVKFGGDLAIIAQHPSESLQTQADHA